jgi:hypothetical protein
MNKQKSLLSVTGYGVPTNIDAIYRKLGYQVSTAKSLRKAVALIKQTSPDVIVAEFVYAPTYGSQLSNFESLFAAAQAYSPQAHFVALCHKDDLIHLEKVKTQSNPCHVLMLPVNTKDLENCLKDLGP